MTRNILLTSVSPTETDPPVRYFSFQKEFSSVYCDAQLDAEAGIKAVLSMHDIDEIIVIGGAGSYDENDELNPVDLGHGNTLYSKDEASLSAYALLQYRIAKYADELPADLEKEDARLPGEVRERLTGFIHRFHEKTPELNNVKPNRLFDVLSQNDRIRENFCPEHA